MCVLEGKRWDVLTRSLRIFTLAALLSLDIVRYALEFQRLNPFDQSASDLNFGFADAKHRWYIIFEVSRFYNLCAADYVAALANHDLTYSVVLFLRSAAYSTRFFFLSCRRLCFDDFAT